MTSVHWMPALILLLLASPGNLVAQIVWEDLNGPLGSIPPTTVLSYNDTVLVGTLPSGMYMSTNGGRQWKRLDPDSSDLTLCFGRSHRGDIIAMQNRKLKRSTDGGATWQVTKMDVYTSTESRYSHIITRADGEILAFTQSSVYYSTDNGGSWSFRANHRASFVDTLAGGVLVSAYDNVYVSTDTGRTWSARSKPAGGNVQQLHATEASELLVAVGGGLQRSTDTGRTWSVFGTTIPSLIVDFIRDSRGRIVVTAAGLYRSNDSARTWTTIPSYSKWSFSDFITQATDTSWYAGTSKGLLQCITARPTWDFAYQNMGKVGSTLVFVDNAGSIYCVTESHGILYSLDRGVSWQQSVLPKDTSDIEIRCILQLSTGVLLAGTRSSGLLTSIDRGQHWIRSSTGPLPDDIPALEQLPSGVILAGSNAGIHISTDSGLTWKDSPTSIQGAVQCFARDDRSGRVYCGSTTGAFVSTDNGVTWDRFDWTPNVQFPGFSSMVVTPVGSILGLEPNTRRIYRTVTGASWVTISLAFAPSGSPLTLASDARGDVYLQTQAGLYLSRNEGNTWEQVVAASAGNNITSMFIGDSGRTYFGTQFGSVYASRDGLWTSVLLSPPLLSPPDKSTRRLENEPFVWQHVPLAHSYRLQISTDSSFVDSLRNDILVADTTDPGITRNSSQRYYWRVRAERNGTIGSWSQIWSFTTKKPTPRSPVLIFPPNGADSVAAAVLFNWDPVPHAEAYSIEVAADSSMRTMVITADTISLTHFMYNPDSVARTYYWRVRATNNDAAGQWSPVWRFTSAPYSGKPSLVSPNPGAIVSANGAFLRWTAPQVWRKTVEVYVCTDSTFTRNVVKAYPFVAGADSTVVGGLQPNARYYWKARCIWSSNAVGEFSDTWYFDTEWGLPMPPIQFFPPDGADSLFVPIRCSWTPVKGTDTYTFEYSGDPLLQSNVTRIDSLTKYDIILDQVPMLATVHWRVRANNSSGSGSWSPIWSFITAPFSGQPILTDPPNGAITGAYDLWFQWQTPFAWQPNSVLEIFTDSSLTQLWTIRTILRFGGVAERILGLEKNTKYYWRVRLFWYYRTYSAYSDTWSFTTTDVVDVDQSRDSHQQRLPAIVGNTPQPFTSSTDISFALAAQSRAKLRIHDALGRLVATLVDDVREAGTHQARFDAQGLPAGVYIARLDTPAGSTQRVMLLVR